MKDPLSEQPAPPLMLSLMLLVSGSCALVFQVVWIRELRLVFGATTASSAAVLAIFMAGLGLGNWLFGRRIDNSLLPLRLYGLLEVGIALSAGLSPFLIDFVRYFYVEVGGQSVLGPGLATLLRLLAAALILSIPTIMMGGTLPAAARAVSIDADQNRRSVAFLYGLNTFGAVIGAGLANFMLLEAFGNRTVLWSACGLNLLLAATALRLSKKLSSVPHKQTKQQTKELSQSSSLKQEPSRIGVVCVSAGIVGFVFFLMEIVWYRMLGPLLGGTTYTFGLILCIALLGIGVGGALYGIVARYLKPSLPFLAAICAVEALLIAIPFWYGDQIAFWVIHQQSEFVASFGDQIWNWFQVGAFVIFPASLVAGFQFPLLIAIAGKGRENIGKHVGWTFASNTLGAISGSIAGGFFLLPIMTAPGLWRFAICLLICLGVVITVLSHRWKSPFAIITATASLFAIIGIAGTGPTAVWRHSGIGANRAKIDGTGRNAEQNFANTKKRQCIWQAEGRESSVAITATDSLAFIVNGKSDGNAYGDAGTQIGLGLIGPLLHKSPKRGLVIGLGTGESAGWMADVEEINAVDVVELEPAVLHMSERCAQVNRNALENPKLQVHFNDAREYLLTVKAQYDIIVSEPSNPYRAGIANLYTREFYESVSSKLNENGLFLQWVQGYEVDDHTVMIVLQTIRSVFPNIQIWRTKARDMVVVCGKSESAFQQDIELLRKRFTERTIREGLKLGWRVSDIEGIVAHYVCGDTTIDKLLKEHADLLNQDDQNFLEYAFAKTVGKSTRFSIEDLHLLAMKLDDNSPVSSDELNSETIAQRRLAMHLHLGGSIPIVKHLSETQQNRAGAYNLYLMKRYSEAVERFKEVEIDKSCSIELMVYAHSLAEAGLPIPEDIMEILNQNNKTEAAAIDAIAYFQQRQLDLALQMILVAFKRLQTNPWGSPLLLDSVLRKAVALSDIDDRKALPIYEQLNQPFSMYRLENKRLIVRYIISEKLEAEHIIESLKALEPHVPWKGWLLESRAKAYAAKNHPLLQQSKNELKQFRNWNH